MGTSQRRGRFRLRDDTSPQGRRGRGPPGCAFQEPPPSVGLPPGPAALLPVATSFLILCHPARRVPSPLRSPQRSTAGDLCPWVLIAPACSLNAPGLSFRHK